MNRNINLKRILTVVFLFLAVGFCKNSLIFGQSSQKVQIVDGNDCESNKAYFDGIAYPTKQIPSARIIIIARLGDGENSRIYNRRRLFEIRTYLERVGVPKASIVTAQGDRVKGRGRVEVYYWENSQLVFTIKRGQSFLGGKCEETG